MINNCIDKMCTTKECRFLKDIELYFQEKCYISRCPDKEPSYLNQDKRKKEIDLIVITESGKRIAIEVKALKLLNMELEKDIIRLINIIDENIDEKIRKEYNVEFTIKNSINVVKRVIVKFIRDFVNGSCCYKFSNKYVNIEFLKKNPQRYSETTYSSSALNKDDSIIDGNSIFFKSIIYDHKGQMFYCNLPDDGKYSINNVLYKVEEMGVEINKKIKSDGPGFKNHLGINQKIFFFDVELSSIVNNILEYKEYKEYSMLLEKK